MKSPDVIAAGAIGAGDQPDADAREQESGDRQGSRQSLRDHGEGGRDGRAENRRYRRGNSHIPAGERAIKNRQRGPAQRAREQRPVAARG